MESSMFKEIVKLALSLMKFLKIMKFCIFLWYGGIYVLVFTLIKSDSFLLGTIIYVFSLTLKVICFCCGPCNLMYIYMTCANICTLATTVQWHVLALSNQNWGYM